MHNIHEKNIQTYYIYLGDFVLNDGNNVVESIKFWNIEHDNRVLESFTSLNAKRI